MRKTAKSTEKLAWLREAIRFATRDECIIWPFAKHSSNPTESYGTLLFSGKPQLAHRVSFNLHYGRWPEPLGRHTCDNPSCVNPLHIISGTQVDNCNDMTERKRRVCGSKAKNAKITEEEVRQMRAEYIPGKRGHATKVLGIKYGLDRKNVYNIVTGRAWKHVT